MKVKRYYWIMWKLFCRRIIYIDLGLAIDVCEIKSLRIREDRKEIKIPQDEGKKILLDNVEAILQENYLYQKYIERPVIINENTIKEIQVADAADLSNFWQ